MQHLEDGLLHELVDGEVPSEQLGPVQRHLAECASCRARLDAARDLASVTDALIEGLDTPAPHEQAETPVLALPVRPTTPRWSRGIGIAASLVVAAGLGYGARDLIPPPGEGPGTTPRAAPTAVVNAPADAIVASEPPAQESPPALTTSSPSPAVPTAEATDNAPREAMAVPPAGERARTDRVTSAEAEIDLRAEVAPPMAPQAARRTPVEALGALAEGRTEGAGREQRPATSNMLVPRDADQTNAKMTATPIVIDLAEAVALLGGRLRLIEGLVPSRLERLGDEVRVIYPTTDSALVLSQWRIGDDLRWRLTGPRGFPADSLAALRRRVER